MIMRLVGLGIVCVLMIPLLREQGDPRREREKYVLLLLFAAIGVVMLLIRFLRVRWGL